MSRILFSVVALFLFACTAVQAKKPDEKAVVADTPEKFELLVAGIRQEMAPGKRYEFLDKHNRNEVNDGLDRMGALLTRAGSVEAMSQEEKTELFSIQEHVNGILAQNADDRLVCTHTPPTGSHIPMTQCKTVRELVARRAAARSKQKELGDTQRALDAITRTGQGG